MLSSTEQREKPGPYMKEQSRPTGWDVAKGWFCPGWFWFLPADLGEEETAPLSLPSGLAWLRSAAAPGQSSLPQATPVSLQSSLLSALLGIQV